MPATPVLSMQSEAALIACQLSHSSQAHLASNLLLLQRDYLQQTLDDTVITSYRAHGFAIALNSDPNAVMAELLGKETGCSKGKGGSMHMFNKEHGFYGGHGIVAAQVPIGTGIAFALRLKRE